MDQTRTDKLSFKCVACKQVLSAPVTASGSVVACPCGQRLRVPESHATKPNSVFDELPTSPTSLPYQSPAPNPNAGLRSKQNRPTKRKPNTALLTIGAAVIGGLLFGAIVLATPGMATMLPAVLLVVGIGAVIGGGITFAICFLMTPAEQRSAGLRPDDLSAAASGKGGIISGLIILTAGLAFLAAGLMRGRIYIFAPIGIVMGIASIVRGLIQGKR